MVFAEVVQLVLVFAEVELVLVDEGDDDDGLPELEVVGDTDGLVVEVFEAEVVGATYADVVEVRLLELDRVEVEAALEGEIYGDVGELEVEMKLVGETYGDVVELADVVEDDKVELRVLEADVVDDVDKAVVVVDTDVDEDDTLDVEVLDNPEVVDEQA